MQGNDKTSDRLVREQLELTPSEPLDLSALSRSRKNLYDTRRVLDRRHHARRISKATCRPDAAALPANQKPVRVNVAVREVQPFQLRYGASYDTERGLGGMFDVSNHNSLGKARVLGLRSRYDAQLREVRGYISQPSLRYWPLETTATVYYREERNPATEITDALQRRSQGHLDPAGAQAARPLRLELRLPLRAGAHASTPPVRGSRRDRSPCRR